MDAISLEQRVAALEADVAHLKHLSGGADTSQPWWEHIVGTFQNDPLYDQALRLGRHYRLASRTKTPTRRKP